MKHVVVNGRLVDDVMGCVDDVMVDILPAEAFQLDLCAQYLQELIEGRG